MYKIDKQQDILYSTGTYSHHFVITLNSVICKTTESWSCITETNTLFKQTMLQLKKDRNY